MLKTDNQLVDLVKHEGQGVRPVNFCTTTVSTKDGRLVTHSTQPKQPGERIPTIISRGTKRKHDDTETRPIKTANLRTINTEESIPSVSIRPNSATKVVLPSKLDKLEKEYATDKENFTHTKQNFKRYVFSAFSLAKCYSLDNNFRDGIVILDEVIKHLNLHSQHINIQRFVCLYIIMFSRINNIEYAKADTSVHVIDLDSTRKQAETFMYELRRYKYHNNWKKQIATYASIYNKNVIIKDLRLGQFSEQPEDFAYLSSHDIIIYNKVKQKNHIPSERYDFAKESMDTYTRGSLAWRNAFMLMTKWYYDDNNDSQGTILHINSYPYEWNREMIRYLGLAHYKLGNLVTALICLESVYLTTDVYKPHFIRYSTLEYFRCLMEAGKKKDEERYIIKAYNILRIARPFFGSGDESTACNDAGIEGGFAYTGIALKNKSMLDAALKVLKEKVSEYATHGQFKHLFEKQITEIQAYKSTLPNKEIFE